MVQIIVVGVVAISIGFAACLRLMTVLEKHHRRSEEQKRELARQREEFWSGVKQTRSQGGHIIQR